ncbi:FUSC family membrane protein [Pedobacter sp. MW01-1-1]|uniref:FUSC family membrane protein n=1 Tax=Pedobacter sp. MW01-1-1 TaxID=3383027 RepID=UPI003FED7AF5
MHAVLTKYLGYMIHKNRISANITYFFLGEYFSDALRNTITVVLPIVIFFYLGNIDAATGIGVGALLISLTDLPDNTLNKLKTAIYSILIFFFTTLLVSLSLNQPLLLAILVTALAFLFSIIAVYGRNVALIGTMALIVGTFVMGLHPVHPVYFSLYLLVGGIWYYLVSMMQIVIRPYRSLHHAIFECLMSSALFLRSKAKNYDLNVPFDSEQKETIKLHIKVNQKHELIRNLLLTDKLAMQPDNKKGQVLLGRAVLLIDLHEQLNALHYDYSFIRKTLAHEASLQYIAELIGVLADELEALGGHVRAVKPSRKKGIRIESYTFTRQQLAMEERQLTGFAKEIVVKIAANIDAIAQNIEMIRQNILPPQADENENLETAIEYPLFLTGDQFSIKEHLSLKSPIFRFSLRLSLAFIFGFFLIWQMEPSKYSYWLFLTLVIVARPKFSLTWKRNQQRFQGSIFGAIIGLTLVYFIKSPVMLISASIVFLLGFYAFNRINYTVSVLCITPAVILTLGSYHGQFDHIIHDRIIYTAIGCFISVVATYIFPVWDSRQLTNKLNDSASKAAVFLRTALLADFQKNNTGKRMARKDANMSFAELSEAIDSAKQEPMTKDIHFNVLYTMQIMLYQMNAVITSLYLSAGQHIRLEAENQQLERIAQNLEQNFAAPICNGSREYEQEYTSLSPYDDLSYKLNYLEILSERYCRLFRNFQER